MQPTRLDRRHQDISRRSGALVFEEERVHFQQHHLPQRPLCQIAPGVLSPAPPDRNWFSTISDHEGGGLCRRSHCHLTFCQTGEDPDLGVVKLTVTPIGYQFLQCKQDARSSLADSAERSSMTDSGIGKPPISCIADILVRGVHSRPSAAQLPRRTLDRMAGTSL